MENPGDFHPVFALQGEPPTPASSRKRLRKVTRYELGYLYRWILPQLSHWCGSGCARELLAPAAPFQVCPAGRAGCSGASKEDFCFLGSTETAAPAATWLLVPPAGLARGSSQSLQLSYHTSKRNLIPVHPLGAGTASPAWDHLPASSSCPRWKRAACWVRKHQKLMIAFLLCQSHIEGSLELFHPDT